MKSIELYNAGKLDEAIQAHQEEVRNDPVNPEKRLFLFELLSFAGDFERAGKQLAAVKYDNIEVDAAVEKYRRIVEADALRRRLFSEDVQPEMFLPAPESMQWRLEAVAHLRENRLDEAAELLTKANEALPANKGSLNDKPFPSLRDGDDLFAGIFEVYAQGKYYWVPIEHVLALGLKKPENPRDILYVPARLTLTDGQEGEVFMPGLYPNSHEHTDVTIKLGRATDWKELHPNIMLGVGQKDYFVGEDPIGILEWRQLFFGEEEAAEGGT